MKKFFVLILSLLAGLAHADDWEIRTTVGGKEAIYRPLILSVRNYPTKNHAVQWDMLYDVITNNAVERVRIGVTGCDSGLTGVTTVVNADGNPVDEKVLYQWSQAGITIFDQLAARVCAADYVVAARKKPTKDFMSAI